MDRLGASFLLIFYVWLAAFVVVVPIFFSVSITPSYWTSLTAFGMVVVVIALTLAVLTPISSICWTILLVLFSIWSVRLNGWQHALASIGAALFSCAVFYALWLSVGGDGISNGYLALGIFGPVACAVVFPLLSILFYRYRRTLRLEPLFGDAR